MIFLCLLRAVCMILLLPGLAHAKEPPNIVIIFTDDQGYQDVGIYGAEGYETPILDQMARDGRRFTDFYVAQPVCSASRAALLTGCYPNRLGITGALGPGAQHGIAASEVTLGELCQSRGYATAVFGKWHLGHHRKFLPLQHGFDEYLGLPYSNDMWPHDNFGQSPPKHRENYPPLPLIDGNERVEVIDSLEGQGSLTARYTERAVSFIDRNHDRPFLLYLAHTMAHVPLGITKDYTGRSVQGRYGEVIMEIDWSVGQVLEALDRHGITDRTLVIYTSDNGPWLNYGDHAGQVGPLREGKGTTFDGGVRVPCIMRWPGVIPARSVCREPAMTIDLFPTIAGLIGADLPDHPIDGLDILPLVTGEVGAHSPHEAYFFYYRSNDLEAMRSGRWKLHFPHGYRSMVGRTPGNGGHAGQYDHSPRTELELYDLRYDPGETRNLAARKPKVLARMLELAADMRADLGDALTKQDPGGRRPPGRIN